MNPLAIRAENFLSYSKLDLDLSGVNLAAIVGPMVPASLLSWT